MKKIFTIAMLIFGGLSVESFGQTATIEQMISYQQTANGMMSNIFGLENLKTKTTPVTVLSNACR